MTIPSQQRSREPIFTILMILIPIGFITILEGGLRLAGYGQHFPLVKEVEKYGSEKYVVNTQVAHRYFNLPDYLIPEASEEIFDRTKKSNALRIVCLGGSTTAGFPYQINATFPFQLQFRLREALLDNYVEVINLGISAVNTYTMLDLLPEVLELEPDVLIIYAGHNEFYGALGAASNQSVGNSRWWINTYLSLRRLALFDATRTIIDWIRGDATPRNDQSIMKVMASNQAISKQSELFKNACHNFRDNLSEIISVSRDAGIYVLTSTLASNLADQPPFISSHSLTDSLDQMRTDAILLEAEAATLAGNHSSASALVQTILDVDSTNAQAHYLQGKIFESLAKTEQAFQAYLRAKEYDLLRFRAPEAFNDIILEVSKKLDVPLIDVDAVFRRASAGLPGENLFHEHLHPTFDGYRLMAQAYFEALRKIQIINPPKPIGWRDSVLTIKNIDAIVESFRDDSAGVTALDIEYGEQQIFYLTHKWPFHEMPVEFEDYVSQHSPQVATLADKHRRKQIFWDQAHYQLAEHYSQAGNLGTAFKEYVAVYLATPENYYPQMKMGDIYAQQQNHVMAERRYALALKSAPDNMHLSAKLGRSRVFLNRFADALEPLANAIHSPSASKFSAAELSTLCYLHAVSDANLENWGSAELHLDWALKVQPGFPAAINLKREIAAHRGVSGD